MSEHSLVALQKSLREEIMIYEAAREDVNYHTNMGAMRKRDAERAKNHIDDMEETIAALMAQSAEG